MLQSYLPSLDGMRAVSILLVLFLHARMTYLKRDPLLGRLGVYIFFVISGLLITWLMIREREMTGRFSLRHFYIRRFLRILPVFWLLLLTVTLLKVTHVISTQWLDILRSSTFTANYPVPNGSGWLGHTWSLSLEEQFYLFWPSLFVLAPRRWIPRLAMILVLCGPLLRILFYFLVPSMRGLDQNGFEALVDLPMAGCFSAFLLGSDKWRKRICTIPAWPTLTFTTISLVIAIPWLLDHLPRHSLSSTIANLFTPTVEGPLIALMLLVLVAGEHSFPFRVLNSPIAIHLGKLSYSIYIWQQLLLPQNAASTAFPLIWRLPAIYLVALCSFNLIERPLLKLRSRFRHGVSV